MSASSAEIGTSSIEIESLTPLHWIAVVLALFTGVLHLYLGVKFLLEGFSLQDFSFVMAGLGYVGAIVLFLLDYRRRLLYLAGIPFTALQIVLYLWINYRKTQAVNATEAIDKAVQVLLIVVLAVLYYRAK